jgi:DNA transformation protein
MTDEDASLVAHVLELLEPLGRCNARRMFGGYGIYGDGLMFGLVFDGRLFLKVDDENREQFRAADCQPFVYHGQKQPIEVSYWSVPESALESSEDMRPWARLGLAAALRKANAKPAKKRAASKKTSAKTLNATKAKARKKR